MNDLDEKELVMEILGLGIVFYSPQSSSHIPEGSDYLRSEYSAQKQIESHLRAGSMVCFYTSSPGVFRLVFHSGHPPEDRVSQCEFKLRLVFHCKGGLVCFRDLYDLMRWRAECPSGQSIGLADGFYAVTLCSDVPESGIIGHYQRVDVYFESVPELPNLELQGIPELCF